MIKVENLEHYKSLIRDAKSKGKRKLSNNYLTMNAVSRYIALGRLYCINNETGIYFLCDEETYYQCHCQILEGSDYSIELLDKPVYVRLIQRQSEDEEKRLWDEQLSAKGYTSDGTSYQIVINPMEHIEEIRKKGGRAISFMERMGMSMGYATCDEKDAILNLQKSEKAFKDYYFVFLSDEEFEEQIQEGHYRVVRDKEGIIRAVQHFHFENGTIIGDWLSVEDAYKLRYGIGSAMGYHSLMYGIDHNVEKYYGWVEAINETSLQYHKMLGYEFTGKVAHWWKL